MPFIKLSYTENKTFENAKFHENKIFMELNFTENKKSLEQFSNTF